ncbi:hydroxyacid dehydrogenase [Candidatus Berkelbacteria bacterium RIFOXYA2_FULL_43_10]|uniref:Hydroxyacid dehydrogenase n=1 Tax=Candidatus Berkelbacteria bacterium RIFOXYA2_FULL_43_10 TaxID=1797472 RepID=A0A1F5EA38_9BACT|nr:MAG: hydroxyacid dehydrogenase [Candidatus Berkelbacteria bacterium RIFOXYA2_FULL_43_10]
MKQKIPQSQIIIYKAENGQTKIDVRFEDETVWLSQNALAELFQTTKNNISLHVKNIFDEGELNQKATVKEFLTVQKEGRREVSRNIEYYNLDLIISIGYRVKSSIATAFRQWATSHLREFIVKGFVLDDERLKNPDLPFDYFDELLKRIQDIRTSEKRFYRKITDIYATSVDYDPTDEMSIVFFQTVQNKLHWVITGKTAAEMICERANSKKSNMGMTNWRGANLRKDEVVIAKNYLNEPELSALNNLVEQYLVFAEGQAMRRVPMHMKDWATKLNGFLTLNDRAILDHAGTISHDLAKELAEKEYDKYHKKRLKAPSRADKDFETFSNKAVELSKKSIKRKKL